MTITMEKYSAKKHFGKMEELIGKIGREKESIIYMLLLEFFEHGGDSFKEKNRTVYEIIENKVDRMGNDGDEEKFENVQSFFLGDRLHFSKSEGT